MQFTRSSSKYGNSPTIYSAACEAFGFISWGRMKRYNALIIHFLLWIQRSSAFQAGHFIFQAPTSTSSRNSYVNSSSRRRPRVRLVSWASAPRDDAVLSTNAPPRTTTTKLQFPNALVASLDLRPLLQRVAAHAATRRGRQALMALVEQPNNDGRKWTTTSVAPKTDASESSWRTSSRRRRKILQASATADERPSSVYTSSNLPPDFRIRLGASLPEVRAEYDRVEQATLALQGWYNLSFPPLYGSASSNDDRWDPLGDGRNNPWSVEFVVDSDDDEWLHHCENTEDITLEHILQAEQVLRMLLAVSDWSSQETVAQWAPLLADVGRRGIDREFVARALGAVQSAVEIVRVRSVTDPQARSTYQFQLNGSTFRALGLLREKADELQRSAQRSTSKESRRLSDLLEEIAVKEREIQRGLAHSILQCRRCVQNGLNTVAELDVVFSKAAFGLALNGQFPCIQAEGRIDVEQFVHPLLALDSSYQNPPVVPIDLRLSCDKRVLTISGMNGGGKSVALKCFGIAACLVRLAIPVPTMKGSPIPRVDFFDNILSSVGDGQDVSRGESTFTAQLNTYSTIVDVVSKEPNQAHLVLLDELEAGTEANAGGAIGQAILEHLLHLKNCRTVVTTHCARLKTVSFESSAFECAAVRRSIQDVDGYRRPTFQLQYGVIGESYAMEAAARCQPPMPAQILHRASELAREFGSESPDIASAEYLQALVQSLDRQVRLAEQLTANAQKDAADAAACRRAMLALASAYDRHLSFLQRRVEDCYRCLKEDSKDSLTIAGSTLDEIRLARKQVESEAELLRDQGLKVLSDSYIFREGESVVVIADGPWNGLTGRVTRCSNSVSLGDDVLVAMSFNPMEDWLAASNRSPPDVSADERRTIPFKRDQLAVWDYDSVWDKYEAEDDGPATSIQDSRRRLSDALSSIRTSSGVWNVRSNDSPNQPAFKSSRERKAAKKSVRKKR